jgi:hypothetical protein
LRLAAVAKSKQYCLSDAEVRGGASCIACASRKTGAPKLSAALIFLWFLSLHQDKERNIAAPRNLFFKKSINLYRITGI